MLFSTVRRSMPAKLQYSALKPKLCTVEEFRSTNARLSNSRPVLPDLSERHRKPLRIELQGSIRPQDMNALLRPFRGIRDVKIRKDGSPGSHQQVYALVFFDTRGSLNSAVEMVGRKPLVYQGIQLKTTAGGHGNSHIGLNTRLRSDVSEKEVEAVARRLRAVDSFTLKNTYTFVNQQLDTSELLATFYVTDRSGVSPAVKALKQISYTGPGSFIRVRSQDGIVSTFIPVNGVKPPKDGA
ncbi:hypothetical protein BOTBODRAFT_189699 [Botryobasidium botryosum FD-172 SS1]|uniref:RRM domain-containing protein n=1 Tax=Botryobasidium botryosum (strain FD-172 SS1) TaxID=930990 RepID=A0A067MIJ9_BOTB1|nr:hypothetical protein BOTBODRAFT_189699 [Botryobasidium botryosum FD-172 SS1]